MTARRDLLILSLLALVIAALVGGTTYALWHRGAPDPTGVVATGDLRISLDGASTWAETSPDVTAPHTITSTDGTADHLATAGDSFTLTQRFTVDLDGDNLAARLDVRWATEPTLLPENQVTATYVVTSPGTVANPEGVSTTPRPLGTAMTLPEEPASFTPADVAAWGDNPWTLTVTLTYTGDSALMVTPDQIGDPPLTDLGTVALDLRQVRDGEGFTS